MDTIFHRLARNLSSIVPEQLVEPSVDKETLEFIEELNREQLENSVNIKGESLGEYHPNTVNIYNQSRNTKVGLGESVKLYDTGELYDSIQAEVDKDSIKVKANYSENILAKLEETYGEFIGLTEENITYVSKKLLPNLQSTLRKKLLGNV